MAKDGFNHTTGKTCYVLIRDPNDLLKIWNGSTFVTYVTANLSTYAILATEQGTASGFYAYTVPVLSPGIFEVSAFERLGGSPAETDTPIAEGDLVWNGTMILQTTQLTPDGVDSILAWTGANQMNLRQAINMIGAVILGKTSGAGSAAESYYDVGDGVTVRLVGTNTAGLNGQFNRTGAATLSQLRSPTWQRTGSLSTSSSGRSSWILCDATTKG